MVDSYDASEEQESLQLLRYTLEEPSKMWINSSRYVASVLYSLTYGKDLGKDGSDDLSAILDVVEGFVRDCLPGSHLVDTFPVLDLLPDVLAPWRRQALEKHEFELKVSA